MNPKHLEIKRKHHHVWADYLLRWSEDGRNVYHNTPSGKIKCDSVRGIGMEVDFYKTCHLSDYDVAVILQWSSPADEDLQRAHRSYLNDFLKLQKAAELYKKTGHKDDVIEKTLKALESNLMENLHSSHEREASLALSKLAEGNLPILYEKNDFLSFVTFLGHQFTRTKNFKTRVFEKFVIESPDAEDFIGSMKKSWWFLSYIFGMNLGRELFLFRSKYTHTLLENNTASPFITSDQPAINIHKQAWDSRGLAPDFLDLYYPVSPKFAYVVSQSDEYSGGVSQITEEKATEVNLKMAIRAKSLIVGATQHSLEPLLKVIGKIA
ncbi:DUF4238 domain-containing protein [Pseudomonas monteilii]|uniref:DUF4238 domain-containing protein n=1 Tax=Pseudomonas monteilii TaxID=76759 RepID=UPI003906875E